MIAVRYTTKKLLKEAVGKELAYQETSMFAAAKPEFKPNGTFPVVGPSATERKWYAQVTMSNGLISKVR